MINSEKLHWTTRAVKRFIGSDWYIDRGYSIETVHLIYQKMTVSMQLFFVYLCEIIGMVGAFYQSSESPWLIIIASPRYALVVLHSKEWTQYLDGKGSATILAGMRI